jgi:uncharacterized protein (TIRG00374 family)
VILFRTVFVRGESRIDWRESYQITMAGLAATRLFAAAGAGGVALTAWALRRSGMPRRVVACRMVAFMALLYGVYLLALLLAGYGLGFGILSGHAPAALTIVPASLALGALLILTAVSFLPADFERRVDRLFSSTHRLERWTHRVATVPASLASGVRTALSLVRSGNPRLLGAIAWWGFDIATLWASFHAFGHPPTWGVIIMGYFVGMVANLLPLPGGIGGVDGGMIGSFIAFGVNPGLAVVAVLVYRGIAFWLPTIPGAIAYLQLRRTVSRWKAMRPDVEPARATP